MLRFPVSRRAPLLPLGAIAAALLLSGCEGKDDRPHTPLSQLTGESASGTAAVDSPGVSGAPSTTLSDASREALARGNEAMRAKKYDDALREYRAAVASSPHNAAPYFGIQMAARAMGNAALADSAARRIRALSPTGDSAQVDPHALPPGHPTVP
jgi:hypothetical protein